MGVCAGLTMAREVPRFAVRRRESMKGGGGENFKVAVRVRPLIPYELRTNATTVSPPMLYYLWSSQSMRWDWSIARITTNRQMPECCM